MANEVKLPRLGQGMEAGTVTRWLKSEGDQVAKGEPLYEIDTDKVTQEVESDFAGVLRPRKIVTRRNQKNHASWQVTEYQALETRATCSYGGEFVAVTETENIFAVQFHPEKSGAAGQHVLENFLRIVA